MEQALDCLGAPWKILQAKVAICQGKICPGYPKSIAFHAFSNEISIV
jgi:hypothetical protein